MYTLNFISEENFKKHVLETLKTYNKTLESIDLRKFNKNLIDPIKLLFDKNIYHKTFDEIIQLEITRQRDKTNTNAIGYFHQNVFKYINNCVVPRSGWDVIYKKGSREIFVEMKNKHNTMNSSSSQRTFIKMQNQILKKPNAFCYLCEVIAPQTRNIRWNCSVDGVICGNDRIRRVSIDQFYKIVTGENDAFFKMCLQLPKTIEELVAENDFLQKPKDSVIAELCQKNTNVLKALYLLAFESYEGFEKLS